MYKVRTLHLCQLDTASLTTMKRVDGNSGRACVDEALAPWKPLWHRHAQETSKSGKPSRAGTHKKEIGKESQVCLIYDILAWKLHALICLTDLPCYDYLVTQVEPT